MPDTWSGPCIMCGEPTDAPFMDDLLCEECEDELDESEDN
jgi:hypothetical protein